MPRTEDAAAESDSSNATLCVTAPRSTAVCHGAVGRSYGLLCRCPALPWGHNISSHPCPPPPQPPATPISDSDDVDDFYLFLLKQQPATAIYWVHFPGMEKALLITTRVVCTKMRLYVMGFVVFFASKNCQ